ncbi:dipeptide epimerase [Rhizobium sp. TRM96647]|uniref:N-acetyl-D-Glu racemase DgcA n=1 Tax=unclassified Rhizobium TaxID=2613769 RepID=UPI0021E7435D|nr:MULTISPECIES: N-acetyl-D-Glu racemase DgcA [unclassified Rhizobium]MCV3737379.1 dipeptide epimerase [Rhizobium sp. TRM96647]MCV3756531.1 dipeptide epimerase [Rhizobium sp. TRM96650]
MRRQLASSTERFPIAGSFTISRGSKTEAVVVTCRLTADGYTGQGECVPYPRYGESVESVLAEIEAARPAIEAGLSREELGRTMRAGAARNAVDCALWDLEAKRAGEPAWTRINDAEPQPQVTAYTISLGEPEAMAAQTAQHAHRALLKVKVGTADDTSRIRAVRAAAPASRIILDANEGWAEETLARHLAICAECDIALVEQPLPAGNDEALRHVERKVLVCADESVHLSADLAALADRYDAINIKLDKAGGLTEALALRDEARRLGLKVMVGCMVGSSLAMAPAVLLAQGADFVDLDGPLLLARDREPALRYEGSLVFPPKASLWG